MIIPFCGESYLGRSKAIDPSRTINLYTEINASPYSKSQITMVGTPGTLEFAEFTATLGSVRLMYNYAGRLFVVAGNLIYELFSDGSKSNALAAFPTTTGYISAADNGISQSFSDYTQQAMLDAGITVGGVGGNQILMVTNGFGYIFDPQTNALTQITHEGFPVGATQVEYLDGYFIVTNDTQTFFVSELYDGLTWPGLAFASVIGTSDDIKTVKALHQQLFFFKEASIEIWYNNGVATSQGSPFMKLQGTVIDYGIVAYKTVAKGSNTILFLANIRNADFTEFVGVGIIEGYQVKIVSPPAINYRISQYELSDAFAYVYNDEGHTFYVLTFPTSDVTLVYDLTTNMWHERSTSNGIDDHEHRHLSNGYTYFNGLHLVSDYRNSKIHSMSSEYYDDNGDAIVSVRIAQPIFDKQNINSVIIHRMIVDMEAGVGDSTVVPLDPTFAWLADGTHIADGSGVAGGFNLILSHDGNPQAWLSWSNDGGNTWSNEYPASIGKQGEYSVRLSWRSLGRARNRVFKLRMPDKVKKVLLGAYLNDGSL
jgi:hypothetical protein